MLILQTADLAALRSSSSGIPMAAFKAPPYLLIAEQLQSHDEQIFRGAVYYLSRIAVNEPKNRETIIDILGRCIDNSKRDQTQLDYIKSKIAEIRQAAAEKPKA